MISDTEVRARALAFPEAIEVPHWGRPSFRVGKRIFATIGEEEGVVVLKIPPDEQEVLLAGQPEAFVTNAWSRQGWLGVRLAAVDEALFSELLESAWRRIAPQRAIRAYESVSSPDAPA